MLGLVADIGSTNARFALAGVGKDNALVLSDVATYPCAEFPTLGDAVRRYCDNLGRAMRPAHACLAVAAPIRGDRIVFTNHGWEFSIAEVKGQLAFEHLFVLNDFTAVSLALPHLAPSDAVGIGASGAMRSGERYAVMGPGTGLGTGALIRVNGRWTAIPSEGGHASFAPQSDAEEFVVRRLAARYGHVSCERLLSGPGLVAIAQALMGHDGASAEAPTAAEITQKGCAGSDPVYRRAVEIFCSALGGVCGDLALTFLADQVFIAGGIVPRIIDFVRASGFRAAFEAKGRFASHMKAVPTAVIAHPNPGLLGAAAHLRQQREQSMAVA